MMTIFGLGVMSRLQLFDCRDTLNPHRMQLPEWEQQALCVLSKAGDWTEFLSKL
jgi:hypothetical protein